MGKKKYKKGSGPCKPIPSIVPNDSADSLIQMAREYLQKEKARDTIATLKRAEKAKGDTRVIGPLLYRAYLLREKQLRDKGLANEADLVKKLAFDALPGIEDLSESDIIDHIKRIDAQDAVKVYLDYTRHHSASVKLMQQIAYKLMMTQSWDALNQLDIGHPLRLDAPAVADAVALMNQADWDVALHLLKPISRLSPYAPIRLFCRAMTLFYQKNDTEMKQILSGIPDDFPLPRVIDSLKACSDPSLVSCSPRIQCLWHGPIGLENLVSDILDDFKHNQLKRLIVAIPRLAKAIYPKDPDQAVFHILELAGLTQSNTRRSMALVKQLMERLLKTHQMNVWFIKIAFFLQRSSLKDAFNYMVLVSKTLSNSIDLNMAFGIILLNAVKIMDTTRPGRQQIEQALHFCPDILKLPKMPEDVEAIKNALVIKSIELDPTNRTAYEMLCTLHQKNRELTPQVEDALYKMAEKFPDDPFPFLELSACYYTKNAFRKAEKALEEASLRAPHDSRVIDRHVMALLIAAERNVRRGKLHLSDPDMEKAEKMDSKRIKPILTEKKILFSMILKKDQSHKIMEREFLPLSNIERIRILNLLYIDIQKNPIPSGTHFQRMIDAEIRINIKQIHDLLPTDIQSLIAPFPQEFYPILPPVHLGATLLINYHEILDKISDQNLVTAFVQIWQYELLPVMEIELKKRLKARNQTYAVQMNFLLEILTHVTGQRHGSHGIKMIVDGCDDRLIGELKLLAKNMVRHTTGDMKQALDQFNFSILDQFDFDGFDPDDEDWNDDDWDEDEEEEEEDDDDDDDDFDITERMNEMISMMEMLVDTAGLRGQPQRIVRKLRKEMQSDRKINKDFNEICQMVKTVTPQNMSREVQILLFDRIID
jgi:tetratricopeptide (TPR) repeat protein